MSLIDSLRSWGESLFTSKKAYIAQQAMPSENSITLIDSDNTASYEYIAPADGYMWISTKYKNESGIVQLYDETAEYSYQTEKQNSNARLKFMIPVRKGDKVQKTGTLTVDLLKFIYSIGGGANRLLSQAVRCVRGGGLCLKNFSARFLKQCLRARRATLRLSACPMESPLSKHIHCQQAPLSSRLTGGYKFKRSATLYKSILSRALLSSITKISDGHLSYCLSRKDRTSCMASLKDSSETYTFGLFTIKQTNNLATEVCHG